MQVVCGKCKKTLEFASECPTFCGYCGQPLSEITVQAPRKKDDEATQPATEARTGTPPPATIGGFRLGRNLGAGGMGAVYEAEEIATGRQLALKLIRPEYAGSYDAVGRFRQEGRIASMVVHPRCVFVLTVDEEVGQPYIVMELMPGKTLKDLVTEQGPLPPEQAIGKILDVIEGLQAAHRMEVIHRDVKPSNCFLEADGRVKVGDFGLAKSLVQDAHHTQTGAFVGTPHFASPEQIRSEAIDVQTDVYSVAATLYYLLTGQPPFAGASSAATLARIVSEPPLRPRAVRPELSPALEAVVLRGLDRDRNRRFTDLEEFRQALLALTPEPLSTDGLLVRLAAMVLDSVILAVSGLILWVVARPVVETANLPATIALSVFLPWLYFTLVECVWGASPGKIAMRLLVCSRSGIDPPGWLQAGLRAGIFVCLILLNCALILGMPFLEIGTRERRIGYAVLASLMGAVVMMATMRRSNGFLGLHELCSGTRVVRRHRPRVKEQVLGSGAWLQSFLFNRRANRGLPQPAHLPARIAGFAIRGALKWMAEDKVLLGEDASLGRRVFLWLRPASEPALPQARRDIGRRTRLRWLGCGTQADLQWDAILAPFGYPLPEFIARGDTMTDVAALNLLKELAGELAASIEEGSLPPTLAVGQVWVESDGRPQLADLPLHSESDDVISGSTAEQRALKLLARVAELVRGSLAGSASLPAPVVAACERLQTGNGYATVNEFLEALSC